MALLFKSFISLVYEDAQKRKLPVSFKVVEKETRYQTSFIGQCCYGDLIAEGEGNSKKISKQNAAKRMLEKLGLLEKLSRNSVSPPDEFCQPGIWRKIEKSTSDINISAKYIDELNEIQKARQEKMPIYKNLKHDDDGMFKIKVTVNKISAVGVGPNREIAKSNAAEVLLRITDNLRSIPEHKTEYSYQQTADDESEDKNSKFAASTNNNEDVSDDVETNNDELLVSEVKQAEPAASLSGKGSSDENASCNVADKENLVVDHHLEKLTLVSSSNKEIDPHSVNASKVVKEILPIKESMPAEGKALKQVKPRMITRLILRLENFDAILNRISKPVSGL